MITASHLSKHFGRTKAVNDISFEVKEGENLVLLGTSGSGKTTTLKMINRLVQPDSGTITINGVDIARQSPETLRHGIGYVLQHNSLFPHYTVAQNIAVVPKLLGWDKNRITERTAKLLERLQLSTDYLPLYPRQLSGGQQQRVNIARALAADPPILLMDEPFGALDAITRRQVSTEFSGIQEFMRKTIIMVTHDIEEAFRIGDRIALMSDGCMVQEGRPADLLFHPANDFVREFFSGSYLRLALDSFKISDIWQEIVSNDATVNGPVLNVLPGDSLWSIMEQTMQSNGNKTVCIRNEEGKTKHVTMEEILKTFSTCVSKQQKKITTITNY